MPPTQHPPTTYRMMRALQVIYQAQARELAARLTLDDVVDNRLPLLDHWTSATAAACQPLLLAHFQSGVVASQRRIAALQARAGRRQAVATGATHDLRTHRVGTAEVFGRKSFNRVAPFFQRFKAAQPIGVSFSLFDPRVRRAVDEQTYTFCQETNDTAVEELGKSVAQLRLLLKRGLERGDAYRLLGREVMRIFADPMRAFRIAVTETSRAVNSGALMNAKENPAVGGKTWLASSDACPLCLEIAEQAPVPLDKPFRINKRGGPYSVILHPPAHPFCYCSWTEVLAYAMAA